MCAFMRVCACVIKRQSEAVDRKPLISSRTLEIFDFLHCSTELGATLTAPTLIVSTSSSPLLFSL